MNSKTAIFLVIVTLALGGCAESTAAQPRKTSQAVPSTEKVKEYRKLFKQLTTAADVGTDAAFGKLTTGWLISKNATAPRHVRDVLVSWEGAAFHKVAAYYRFEKGRISLTWKASMRIREKYDEARPILMKKLRSFGLEPTDSPRLPHLQETYQKLKRRTNPPQVASFRRKSDRVIEEIVVDVEGGLIGGRHKRRSQIDLYWAVSCPWEGAPPAFDQLPQVCRCFRKQTTPEIDLSLLEVVSDQPVFATTAGTKVTKKPVAYTGFSGTFPANVRQEFEAELKKLGFEIRRTHPLPAENKQFMWHRFADDTYVDVITTTNKDHVRLIYAPPRREPRQTVKIDDLTFQNEADENLLRKAYGIATRLAKPSWTHDPLGGWSTTDYRAIWKSLGRYENWRWSNSGFDRRPPDRGVHAIELIARRDRDRGRHVHAIDLKAKWCPANAGWSARFELNTSPKKRMLSGFVRFAHYPKGQEYPDKSWGTYLRFGFYRVTKEFDGTRYSLSVRVPHDKGIAAWTSSPESLRDTAVSWLDALIAAWKEEVHSGRAVDSATLIERAKTASLSGGLVFVAIPDPNMDPREPMPSNRKLTVEEKDLIIREATENIEKRKKLILENFNEMHAALLKTFPLNEIFEAVDPK